MLNPSMPHHIPKCRIVSARESTVCIGQWDHMARMIGGNQHSQHDPTHSVTRLGGRSGYSERGQREMASVVRAMMEREREGLIINAAFV